MEVKQWRRVSSLYEELLDRPPAERAAFLTAASGGDDELRHEVESLLAQDEREGPLDRAVWIPEDLMVASVGLAQGDFVGPYRIEGVLGAGGMGEVYRARDTKLGRSVALKVLPARFGADPDRVARFQREAQLLAALNHPHIAAIYGIEQSSELRALVLELVEGETLADRIARGRIRLAEALPIARQIAEAVEAAHEQGIIHRDLKPANIKLTADAAVKVLDFGLARLAQQDGSAPADMGMSPTITSPAMATAAGIILGTAAYMAPEQAKGRAADKRSDIWAFGCVLFELLTGRRAFEGDGVSDTLAAVLRAEPDWTALPAATPTSLSRLLRRCLAREPRERIQHMGDVRLELKDVATDAPAKAPRTGRIMWLGLAAALAAVLISVVMLVRSSRAPGPAPEARVELTVPPTSDPFSFQSFAISPDGQTIAFVADLSTGTTSLWLRSLTTGSTRPLQRTENAYLPFWSPDGRSLGFFAGQALKTIELGTGTVRTLTRASGGPSGGTWNRDNVILFVATQGNPIRRISAAGGEPAEVIPARLYPVSPQFLPDGRHFLFFGIESGHRGIYVSDLEGLEPKRVVESDAPAVLGPSNHLFFVRQGVLFAQPLDLDRLELTGTPLQVVDEIAEGGPGAPVSASPSGSIIYRPGPSFRRRQLAWIDRSGRELERVGGPLAFTGQAAPSLSPDGRHLAMSLWIDGAQSIWLFDLVHGMRSRFTFGTPDVGPIWSPDGTTLLFNRTATRVFQKPVSTAGDETPFAGDAPVTDWSKDGFLIGRAADQRTGYDIWALDLNGDEKRFPVVQTAFDERDAQFSPNGKWIAFQSNESGRYEIYVQTFPKAGAKRLVSTDGGAQVRWRRDGKELFYIALDGQLMSVPVQFGPDETIEVGTPMSLFATNVGGAVPGISMQQYVVSQDGQRFLMNTVIDPPLSSPIHLILNWARRPL